MGRATSSAQYNHGKKSKNAEDKMEANMSVYSCPVEGDKLLSMAFGACSPFWV